MIRVTIVDEESEKEVALTGKFALNFIKDENGHYSILFGEANIYEAAAVLGKGAAEILGRMAKEDRDPACAGMAATDIFIHSFFQKKRGESIVIEDTTQPKPKRE